MPINNPQIVNKAHYWTGEADDPVCKECAVRLAGDDPVELFCVPMAPDRPDYESTFDCVECIAFHCGDHPALYRDFVELVARMTLDGEEIEGEPWEMSIDDAFDTVNSIITKAREILALRSNK